MAEFDGKVALVTGAGSGIGRAVAIGFAQEGAKVLIADIGEKGASETVEMITSRGGVARFQQCDVADQSSVEAMVNAALQSFGKLDCAVNSAGIDPEITPEPLWDIGTYDRIMAINLRGIMLCLKAETEAMRKNGGGAIVNFSSFAGLVGIANKPFYAAAKHGVIGLTRSVALDQGKYGIRVNAVCPGFTRTPMAFANFPDQTNAEEIVIARNPARRIGEPEDMAAATLFLCSDKARFILGQSLAVDGGISIQ